MKQKSSFLAAPLGAFDLAVLIGAESSRPMLNCTVECSPMLGPLAFDAVEQAVAGEELPKNTVVDDQVYDQSTAAAVIDSRKY